MKLLPQLDKAYPIGGISYDEIWPGIEEEIVQCGKVVYVGSKPDTEAYKDYLEKKYPTAKKFRISRDHIKVPITGWTFPADERHRIVRGLRRFLDSGIYHQLNWYEKYNHIGKNNVNVKMDQGVRRGASRGRTSEGLQIVFLAWVVGLTVSLMIEIGQQILIRGRLTGEEGLSSVPVYMA